MEAIERASHIVHEASHDASKMIEYYTYSHSQLIIFTVVIVLVALWLWRKCFAQGDENWPPGPSNYFVMVFDYLRSRKPFHRYLLDLGKKHGPIVSIPMIFSKAIYLNDYQLLMKTIGNPRSDAYCGRPREDYGSYKTPEIIDTEYITSEGPNWVENRRLFTLFFDKVIFEDRIYEERIKNEMAYYCDYLSTTQKKPFDPREMNIRIATNIIFLVCLGKRYDYGDGEFIELVSKLEKYKELSLSTSTQPVMCYMRFLPIFWRSKRALFRKSRDHAAKIFKDIIEDHRRNYIKLSRKDLIDTYLTERKFCASLKKSAEVFDDSHLVQHIIDLNKGGRLSALVVLWVYQYLIAKPDVQQNVSEEIVSVIGYGRRPCWSDRDKMPYTQAVIKEVMRITSILAFNIPRKTTHDVVINEYYIPKDTAIFTNLYSVHRNELLFKSQDYFNPDRFIKDGKVFEPEAFMPYSTGSRKCCCTALADMEQFLHITTVLQKYKLVNPENQKLDLERSFGLDGGIKAFKVIAIPR